MAVNNEESDIATTCVNSIDKLEWNGLIEAKKRLVSVMNARLLDLERSANNGNDRYPMYAKEVLVPVRLIQYLELVKLFGVPFRSIVGEMGAYRVEKLLQEGNQVHWSRKNTFGWMFFETMVKHWHGQVTPVGKGRVSRGFMGTVFKTRPPGDCGEHCRGTVCDVKVKKNPFCCNVVKFGSVKPGGETLFQKFVEYMQSKEVTQKDVYLQLLPKYEGGHVVVTPSWGQTNTAVFIKEPYGTLQELFTTYARYPMRWGSVENALFREMKAGRSALSLYLVVVMNMNIEVWSWPNEVEKTKKSGPGPRKKTKIHSGKVRRCIVSSFNKWADVWAEVERGICLCIRKAHFVERSRKVVVEDMNTDNVVAMDGYNGEKGVKDKVYVLQIVDRKLKSGRKKLSSSVSMGGSSSTGNVDEDNSLSLNSSLDTTPVEDLVDTEINFTAEEYELLARNVGECVSNMRETT